MYTLLCRRRRHHTVLVVQFNLFSDLYFCSRAIAVLSVNVCLFKIQCYFRFSVHFWLSGVLWGTQHGRIEVGTRVQDFN